MRISSRYLFSASSFNNAREVLMTDVVRGNVRTIPFLGCVKYVQTMCKNSAPTPTLEGDENPSSVSLKHRKVVPDSNPLSAKDVNLLTEFFDKSTKLVILTGAGISTECGIPDYSSQYSSGFRPTTHQEFLGSSRAQKRYWAKNYPVWRKFHEAKPGPAHTALASLEKANRINFMISQNVDGLHHRAGSNPLELHGTVHMVACVNCRFSFSRESFQDQLNSLNPKWEAAIENLYYDSNFDKSFGMKQRPAGDIEIDENFWEEDLHLPTCPKCKGILKPDVVLYGDNIPSDRVNMAIKAAYGCDAFLVLGSSLATMFPFSLLMEAHEAGAATAIINIGNTEADNFVDLKINARVGEILPRLLNITGSLSVPTI